MKEIGSLEFESAFHYAAIGMALVSPEGKFLKVNQALQEIVGYSEDELLAIDFQKITHPKDLDIDLQHVQELLAGKVQAYHLEKRYFHKNGKIVFVLLSVSLIRDENQKPKYFISQIQDMTEKKMTEEALILSSHLASLGQMASGIAHEINNPLSIICGFVEQMQKKSKSAPLSQSEVEMFCDKIDSTSRRISKIIKGLRSYSRDATYAPKEHFPLSHIVADTLSLCTEKMKSRHVDLRVSQFPAHLILDCSPVQISQVLLNLLNNSFDAVKEQKVKWIAVDYTLQASNVLISVTDSGAGIPLEIQNRITEPFFTTKQVGQGSGLGLSICLGIVKDHGGNLYLDKTSKHTRFIVDLPIISHA